MESHASQNGTWTGGDLDGSAMEDVPKSAQQVSEDELLHHASFGVFWAHAAFSRAIISAPEVTFHFTSR